MRYAVPSRRAASMEGREMGAGILRDQGYQDLTEAALGERAFEEAETERA